MYIILSTPCINSLLQILTYARKKYYILGETLDIAAGNCIDRLARVLKLPNEPCPGYNVEQLAKEGKKLFPLSYSVKGMDMSFSGILTQITGQAKQLMNGKNTTYSKADLCMSLQVCLALQRIVFTGPLTL